MEEYPRQLKKGPLAETVFEIRFTSSLPDDAVFGIIYQSLLAKISTQNKVINLPILQIPPEIRSRDPNFRYQQYYQIHNTGVYDLIIGVGPRAISFSNRSSDLVWEKYHDAISSLLNEILKPSIFIQIERTGLRYINVLDEPLFKSANLQLTLGANQIGKDSVTNIMTEVLEPDSYKITLQLKNNARISIQGQKSKIASMIDIDVTHDSIYTFTAFKNTYDEILVHSHLLAKQEFFDLLDKEYIKTFDPIFDEDK